MKPHKFIDGVEYKWCSVHQGYEPLSSFNKSAARYDGYAGRCRESVQQLQKKWREGSGRAKAVAGKRRYKKTDKAMEALKKYKKGEAGRATSRRDNLSEKGRDRKRKYCKTDKHHEYIKNYRKTEVWREGRRRISRRRYLANKLSSHMSNAIRRTMKPGVKASRHWEDLIPYTETELREHLERLFEPHMDWDNYGQDGWSIDHIIPIALWEYETPEDPEFQNCWALENLMPRWHTTEIAKGHGSDQVGNVNKSDRLLLEGIER